MSLFRCASMAVLLSIGLTVANAQTEKALATDDEINLVLQQTDMVAQESEPIIDQEETLMGKSSADAVAKDRQAVSTLEMEVKALKKHPQGFNSPLGFALLESLNDASRNLALCASYASSQVGVLIINRDTENAHSLLQLAQSCGDNSALIYMVSQNADLLYQRYLDVADHALLMGAEALKECTESVAKNCPSSH